MATTTTNYGFDVPTSSDLVKNGATQIALLGQDLDTFLFRPFTRNGIINSGMNVAQRGTTFTSTTGATYTLDRWQGYRTASAAYNISQQSTADTTNLPFIQYCARVGRPSGNTATNIVFYVQTMETVNSRQFSGKTVTLSFYARAGANYSAASNALGCEVVTGTGTDQNAITGFTGAASAFSQNNTLTTTWQRFTITGSIASTSTQLGLNFYYTPVGTAGANDYFEVTGVQVEVGSQASPFIPAGGGSPQSELAMCQRYYRKSYNQAVTPGTSSSNPGIEFAQGYVALASASPYKSVSLAQTMRTAPTVTIYSFLGTTGRVSDNNGNDLAASSGLTTYVGDAGFTVSNQSGGLVTPTGGGYLFHYVASAEL
jgi:hypothetical protein